MIYKTPLFLTTALAVVLPVCSAFAVTATGTNVAANTSAKMTELFGDPPVAKGKGVEIKRSELDNVLVNAKSTAAARGQPIPPQYLIMVEQQLLARLIHVKLLLSKATDADKAAGKERADKQVGVLLKQGSEDRLNLQLKTMGITREEFLAKVTEEATAQLIAERELKIDVTDEEAKKFYDDHPSQFEEPEKVRASHILLATRNTTTGAPLTEEQTAAKRKQMEDLLKRARAGEDFAKLATQYSEDPGSKERGGEYVFGRGQMVPEFEAAAFALNTNQISDIITTAYGFHIIKVAEKIPAKKLTYAEVADNLKEALKQQAMMKQLPDYMSRLRKEANVEILDQRLVFKEEPADLPGEPGTPVKPAATEKPAVTSKPITPEKPKQTTK
jgi:peptidyl-prolyl cis-trans isomerase C